MQLIGLCPVNSNVFNAHFVTKVSVKDKKKSPSKENLETPHEPQKTLRLVDLPFKNSQWRFSHQCCSSSLQSQLLACCLCGHWRRAVDSASPLSSQNSYTLTPGLILSAFLWVRVWVNMTAWFSRHWCQCLLVLRWSSPADWTCLSVSCWFHKSEHDSRQFSCQRCHSHCRGHFRWHQSPPTIQMSLHYLCSSSLGSVFNAIFLEPKGFIWDFHELIINTFGGWFKFGLIDAYVTCFIYIMIYFLSVSILILSIHKLSVNCFLNYLDFFEITIFHLVFFFKCKCYVHKKNNNRWMGMHLQSLQAHAVLT